MGIHSEMEDDLDLALMLAVEMGDVDQVINLIENYKQNTHRYKHSPRINDCLMKSVETENWALTHLFLVKYNADVNVEKVNTTRSRPIHIAAANGNVDVAKEVLNRGSLVNVPNGEGKYPIQLAVEQNHTKMVELLVNEGAAINRTSSPKVIKWEHPLHTAIANNNWDIFDILVRKGARINTVNYRGETCLHYAIRHQQFTLLQKLCERRADVNLGCPLRTAVMFSSFQMAAMLIKFGAKVSPANDNGDTILSDLPMVYKKDANRDSDIHKFVYQQILTGSKDRINSRDVNDFTPLHHAAMAGSLEVAQMFLDIGANINATTRHRNLTPLHFAIGPGGCPELAVYLIQAGARTDIQPHEENRHGIYRGGENLLNQLVLSASIDYFCPVQLDLLKLVIQSGCQINCQDERDCTALERYILLANASYWAGLRETTLRNKEVIAIFVAAGARLGKKKQKNSSRADHAVSPLCRVTWYGDFTTSRFLIDSGVDIAKEKWIHFQGRTAEVEEYLCELREVAKVPPKLLFLCRNVIRHQVAECNGDRDLRPALQQLPLPASVRSLLKLDKEVQLYLESEG